MTAIQPDKPRSLTKELLARQRDLTAVARFSRWHDRQPSRPAPRRSYRDLIPLTAPGPGQQYAFEVDLDKCSGCKACVSACHSLNGLDDGEAWRETGLLVSDDWRRPFQQTITTACHHCVEPGCLEGCPVLAYDKDPLTGIVKHLDDQCIGCQYCVMKCPYDAPKYSATRGIVRKCDMCSSRLAAGEAPACVQACPTSAIKITLVEPAKVRGRHRGIPGIGTEAGARWLPAAPDAAITLPTTHYKTRRILPGALRAGDREELKPEPPHWPLVFMLVLTQLSVGMFAGALLVGALQGGGTGAGFARWQTAIATVAGLAGLLTSILHLGRPLGAWRSFLGLRKSWLSREIVGFGLFAALALAATVAFWTLGTHARSCSLTTLPLTLSTALAGLFSVCCSAMVYADTKREYWGLASASGKFLGTTLLLGATGTVLVLVFTGAPAVAVKIVCGVAAVAGAFKLAVDQRILAHFADDDFSPLHKTALLLTDRFGRRNRARAACTVLGGICLPLLTALQLQAGGIPASVLVEAALALGLCLAGELIERMLFFTAVQPVKMPGAVAS